MICNNCKKKPKGCNRTVGKIGGVYKCDDYAPVIEWQDVTTYSRGDRERKPTCYEIKHGSLRVVITCGHIYHRPDWVLHCYAIGIDTKPITTFIDSCKFTDGDNLETVQARAIEIVEARLDEIRSDMIIIKKKVNEL